jgi:hypothetical protein
LACKPSSEENIIESISEVMKHKILEFAKNYKFNDISSVLSQLDDSDVAPVFVRSNLDNSKDEITCSALLPGCSVIAAKLEANSRNNYPTHLSRQ